MCSFFLISSHVCILCVVYFVCGVSQFLSRNNLPHLEGGSSFSGGVFPPGNGPVSIPGRLKPVSVKTKPETIDTVNL